MMGIQMDHVEGGWHPGRSSAPMSMTPVSGHVCKTHFNPRGLLHKTFTGEKKALVNYQSENSVSIMFPLSLL